ncbi:MAG: hypothetical protein AAFV80_09605 [Bacteroidota bacterium]
MQDGAWPNCPIIGEIDVSTTITGLDVLDKEYIDPYLHLGHGYLYVFYAPQSKVVAYLLQM